MFLRSPPQKHLVSSRLGLVTGTTSMISFGLPKHSLMNDKGNHLRKMIEERNEEDKAHMIEEYKYNISRAYPYLAGKITDPEILAELDYIRIIYTLPLPAERKILLRSKILEMIESGKLSEEACDGLILLLRDYRAL